MFKFGDKVWSVEYGWGVVVEIDKTTMPIGVRFGESNKTIVWYYEDGRTSKDEHRTLFFNEMNVPPKKVVRKTAKEMIEECEEVKFKPCDRNYYIYISSLDTELEVNLCTTDEILQVKYISQKDAIRIVRECKENNIKEW